MEKPKASITIPDEGVIKHITIDGKAFELPEHIAVKKGDSVIDLTDEIKRLTANGRERAFIESD